MGDMPAYTLLVPDSFRAELGVKWDPTSRQSYANLAGRVVDPSTGGELHIHPVLPFEFMQAPGMPQINRPGQRIQTNGNTWMPVPQNASEMALQVLLPALRPGVRDAKFVELEDMPKVVEAYEAMMKPATDAMRQKDEDARRNGMDPGQNSMRFFVQRIRVSYVEQNVATDEDFCFVMMVMHWRAAPDAFTGQPGPEVYRWSLVEVRSIRARAGQLDAVAPPLLSVALSARKLPEYAAVMDRLASDLAQADLRAAIQRAEIHRRNAAELARMNQTTYTQQQASRDRMHDKFIDSIRGVDQWTDGQGNSYAIPQQYGVVWTNNHGQVYVTNDPTINPGVTVDPALNWTRLEREP